MAKQRIYSPSIDEVTPPPSIEEKDTELDALFRNMLDNVEEIKVVYIDKKLEIDNPSMEPILLSQTVLEGRSNLFISISYIVSLIKGSETATPEVMITTSMKFKYPLEWKDIIHPKDWTDFNKRALKHVEYHQVRSKLTKQKGLSQYLEILRVEVGELNYNEVQLRWRSTRKAISKNALTLRKKN